MKRRVLLRFPCKLDDVHEGGDVQNDHGVHSDHENREHLCNYENHGYHGSLCNHDYRGYRDNHEHHDYHDIRVHHEKESDDEENENNDGVSDGVNDHHVSLENENELENGNNYDECCMNSKVVLLVLCLPFWVCEPLKCLTGVLERELFLLVS